MSPTVQAVEVVQSAYAAFGRGDTPALLSLIADDVEWKFIGAKGLPYTGTFRTRDEVANWFAGIPEVDDVLAFEPREFMPAGDNVTVLGWERTQARPSGEVFETEWAHVFTVRNGRIVRFWGIYDTEASAAARG
ncbi:MAG TPA: nuclear transport factor 2 family protein [Terrimicrobium sp.]